MNRISCRTLSLFLAVIFLFSAAGMSFSVLFHGTNVFAADAAPIEIKSFKLKDMKGNSVSAISPGDAFSSLTIEIIEKNMTEEEYKNNVWTDDNNHFTATVTSGCFKPTSGGTALMGEFSKTAVAVGNFTNTIRYEITFTSFEYTGNSDEFAMDIEYKGTGKDTRTVRYDLPLSSSDSGGDNRPTNEFAIQSIEFLNSDGNHITQLRHGSKINELVITIKDSGFSAALYNDEVRSGGKKLSVSWNYDTLEADCGGKTVVDYIKDEAIDLSSGATSYTIRISNLRYTGKTDKLELAVSFPRNWGLEQRKFSEDIAGGEIYDSSSRWEWDDDDDDDSSSRPDIAPPTPNIIVSSYDYGGGSVTAASSFQLNMTFTNTSKKLPIDNIVVKITMPEALTLTSSSNTFYIESLSKQSSVERSIGLSVKPNAEPISHPIKISFSYEAVIDEARKQLTSEEEISIPVSQLDRFSLNPVEVPEEIYIGEGNSISATFVNKGKTTIYNVSAEIVGENLAHTGQRQFIGNIEGGKEDSADFTIDGIDAGEIKGEIIITYEDANMNIGELRSAFTANAVSNLPPPMEDMSAMAPPSEEDTAPWHQTIPQWGWVTGGCILILFIAFVAKVMRERREKAAILEDDDEDY